MSEFTEWAAAKAADALVPMDGKSEVASVDMTRDRWLVVLGALETVKDGKIPPLISLAGCVANALDIDLNVEAAGQGQGQGPGHYL